MRSSLEKSDTRAKIMIDIVAKVACHVAGVTVNELRSSACTHRITRARFIFVDLCSGVVSPLSMVSDYLSKNNSMIAYYKRSHNEYYSIYKDFRELSDKADRILTDLLTNINGTFEDVFQKEEQ